MDFPLLSKHTGSIWALATRLVLITASVAFHSAAFAEPYDVADDTLSSIHEYVHGAQKTAPPQDTSPVKNSQLDLQDLFWNNSGLTSERTSFNYFLCGADIKPDSKKAGINFIPTLSGFNDLYETTTEMMSQQITLLSSTR